MRSTQCAEYKRDSSWSVPWLLFEKHRKVTRWNSMDSHLPNIWKHGAKRDRENVIIISSVLTMYSCREERNWAGLIYRFCSTIIVTQLSKCEPPKLANAQLCLGDFKMKFQNELLLCSIGKVSHVMCTINQEQYILYGYLSTFILSSTNHHQYYDLQTCMLPTPV